MTSPVYLGDQIYGLCSSLVWTMLHAWQLQSFVRLSRYPTQDIVLGYKYH